MKSILSYILIIIGIVILYISTSRDVMRIITEKRNDTDAWWGAHNSMDKGDLVNMAYLDYAEKFHSERGYVFSKPQNDGFEDIDLYLNGDSYTFKIPDSAFRCVNRYEYAWVYLKHIQYKLDTTKRNILILEHAERYVPIFYSGLDLLKVVYSADQGSAYDRVAADMPPPELAPPVHEAFSETLFHKLFKNAFNDNVNQNIEYNLFNYNFLNMPRLVKATMNYQFFNRASGNVVISKDGNNLYLKETTDANEKGSSYYQLPDAEYNTIVNNMNVLYEHYIAEGFDEVYLAPIPNPVTISEPSGYNELIPRLQQDATLKMKCIDVYSIYKETSEKIYRPGDSHWNNVGMQLWLEAVNDTLRNWCTP